jgi:hypothetical protein
VARMEIEHIHTGNSSEKKTLKNEHLSVRQRDMKIAIRHKMFRELG